LAKWIEYGEEDQGQVLGQEGESVNLLDDCCQFIPSSSQVYWWWMKQIEYYQVLLLALIDYHYEIGVVSQ
jgi:hypothetical protein